MTPTNIGPRLPDPTKSNYSLALTILRDTRPPGTELSGIAINRPTVYSSYWSANYTTSGSFPSPDPLNNVQAKAAFQRHCPTNAAVTTCEVVTVNINSTWVDKWQVRYQTAPHQEPVKDPATSWTLRSLFTTSTPTPQKPAGSKGKTNKPKQIDTNNDQHSISKVIKVSKRLKLLDCIKRHTKCRDQVEAIETMKQSEIASFTGTPINKDNIGIETDLYLESEYQKIKINIARSTRLELYDELTKARIQKTKQPTPSTTTHDNKVIVNVHEKKEQTTSAQSTLGRLASIFTGPSTTATARPAITSAAAIRQQEARQDYLDECARRSQRRRDFLAGRARLDIPQPPPPDPTLDWDPRTQTVRPKSEIRYM